MLVFRFIPAGAGNIGSSRKKMPGLTVYPRWRGEHSGEAPKTAAETGLSPLARGTLWYRLRDLTLIRFIPAGAGNIVEYSTASWRRAVYPRWRGEHRFQCPTGLGLNGLSPLARGTSQAVGGDDINPRFIPAGAGNIPVVYPQMERYQVYPRWRGEHTIKCNAKITAGGLSPLARGTSCLKENSN